ncbi:MAG TPA: fused MFS/spermidine synthase, partial [Thermoanaerobaculia bacterium]
MYQTVWLREFRLVFGASTGATAAVLAIFLGGLGLGGLLIGRRVDRAARPLLIYGVLELAIALWAAFTPLLLRGAGAIYFKLGGSLTMGSAGATAVRLFLALLVLAPATLLMGGTLPAATGAVESDTDTRRQRFATVYGLNTLGAVAGAMLATFVLLERFGNRYTLWLACLFNIFIALIAILLGKRSGRLHEPSLAPDVERRAPLAFVAVAAGLVGFVFMMLELVWYRALAPVLGGTTFTFGLILAVALLGIGAGSCLYLLGGGKQSATLRAFALTCALEALLVIVPFAIGDDLAMTAAILRNFRTFGFEGMIGGWAVITLVVVFPAALLSGIQFPVLVSLLGSGRRDVGEHVGVAYAANTAGAFLGAVGTGFGLLPLLTVAGAWRIAAIVLALLSLVTAALAVRRRERMPMIATSVLVAILALTLSASRGPTAAWRHSPIGAGRVETASWGPNDIIDFMHLRRRAVSWQEDGLESSVALSSEDGHALMVNGKSDGHARIDAGTQVMSGLLGSLLHPKPKRILVVGLGTGTTGGWLAAVPEVQQVDIVEIEPSIVRIGHRFAPVNHDVMRNPKAKIRVGDAREVLLVDDGTRYDMIVSEPSNPYRAGVASLFTADFYRNVSRRLAPGGYFLQWMQGYEVDSDTLRTVYATYLSVFPNVTTWQTQRGDLLLIGSTGEIPVRVDQLRQRIATEPYRTALEQAWRVQDVEGILAHYVCGTSTAKRLARGARLNTDDRTVIEFGFARTVGDTQKFDLSELKVAATLRADREPRLLVGTIDPWTVAVRRQAMITAVAEGPIVDPTMSPELRGRMNIHAAYVEGRYRDVLMEWQRQQRGPSDSAEWVTFAEALAEVGAPQAETFINLLAVSHPIEADIIKARLRFRQGRPEEAADLLVSAFTAYRRDPWPLLDVTRRGIGMLAPIARTDPSGRMARRFLEATSEPFCVNLLNEARRHTMLELARISEAQPCNDASLKVLAEYEPSVPWQAELLEFRADCYRRKNAPLAAQAERDL